MFNNIFKDKRVVITGHTGFKGSWLSIWLKSLGAELYGYSLAPQSDRDNFATCGLEGIFARHEIGDINDFERWNRFFQESAPDFAFHLAAQPLVLESYRDPQTTFMTNVMGVVHFFEAVRQSKNVKVAINVTSDKCYDNKESMWGYREIDPMGGKDPYSCSKGCAELITSSYVTSYFNTNESGCRIASARAGNVIGGGDWAMNRIVPDFFRAFQAGENVISRNPQSVRPWQHVLEPLSGYLHLAANLFQNNVFSGGWNFGPDNYTRYTVLDLIESLRQKTGFRYEVRTVEADANKKEAGLLQLDISKAATLLKWRPVLNFPEFIEFTVSGYLEDDGRQNMLASRQRQIAEYCSIAKDRALPWAQA